MPSQTVQNKYTETLHILGASKDSATACLHTVSPITLNILILTHLDANNVVFAVI